MPGRFIYVLEGQQVTHAQHRLAVQFEVYWKAVGSRPGSFDDLLYVPLLSVVCRLHIEEHLFLGKK